MARLATNGAELQTTGAAAGTERNPDGQTSGTATIDTTLQRSGAACWKLRPLSGARASVQYSVIAGQLIAATVAARDYFSRIYVYWDGTETPVIDRTFMRVSCTGGSANIYGIAVASVSGTDLTFKLAGFESGSANTNIASITGTYSGSAYHRFEMRTQVASTTSVIVDVMIDGASVLSGGPLTRTVIGASASGPVNFIFGADDTVASTITFYGDDIAINDGTGASQNSWCGDGKALLLVPVSDNSVGASWTLGTGTAIAANGFDSVNNKPPLGVADLAALSDPKQIRNAAANTNYVANMTTYTTAGIVAADTVNAVIAYAIHAAPVSTGAKTGALQITANPAEGAATAFQSTSNRYHSGTNAGTYPTGWFYSLTAYSYAPSLTLGTNPTLSLNITGGTTSRIAMACGMGIVVDYTPAVAAQPPYVSPMPPLLAQ